MIVLWGRIEAWLEKNAPDVLSTLQGGASEEEIRQTEQLIGVSLQDEMKESYRIHNGQSSRGIGLIEGRDLLSLEGIRKEWSIWKRLFDQGAFREAKSEPLGPILSGWWLPQWIPLTTNGCGDNHCLDMNPAPGGNLGQIIMIWHDALDREVIAPNFKVWLEDFAEDLEGGEYVLSDDYGGLVNWRDV